MNPIQTIRMGILRARVRAGRMHAIGERPLRRPRTDSRGAQSTTTMPDANTWRHAPGAGTLMPQGAAGGEAADGPSTGANGAQGDRPLPGTPPLMQY